MTAQDLLKILLATQWHSGNLYYVVGAKTDAESWSEPTVASSIAVTKEGQGGFPGIIGISNKIIDVYKELELLGICIFDVSGEKRSINT